MDDFKSTNHQYGCPLRWVVPQYDGVASFYDPMKLEKLFRLVALNEGEAGMSLV